MLIVPYKTDAPVYYWPYATVGLIVVNTLLFLGFAEPFSGHPPESIWILSYGEGLRPDQWFGSSFMHEGFGHLLSNMIFLWVFGLVVEGKLGPLRFLICYLSIGIGEAAVEQACMLGYQGPPAGSLGASAAIFGVMAMAAVWAPVNEVSFFWWVFFYAGVFDVPVGAVAVFYVGLDITLAAVLGAWSITSFLHVLGAAIGFVYGVVLLKRGVIDCEGWDLFTRFGNQKGQPSDEEEPAESPETRADRKRQAAVQQAQMLAGAREQVGRFLDDENPLAAEKLYRKMARVGEGLRLDAATLHRMISGLQAQGEWKLLAPLMSELIEVAPRAADPLRVKLAQVCVAKLDRPGRALELLGEANDAKLSEKQRETAKAVASHARAMQQRGVVELDEEGW